MNMDETKAHAIGSLISLAEAQIGAHEEGGNNMGPRILAYQEATWLKPGPWPWCAAFICWLLREWTGLNTARAALNLPNAKAAEAWRPRGAGAFWFLEWARSHNLPVLPENVQARRGDLVVFDFSHIGLVTSNQDGRMIETIEGNTNGSGGRDSSSGDGVWRKARAYSLTSAYIRLIS